jgi:uncharacterized protein
VNFSMKFATRASIFMMLALVMTGCKDASNSSSPENVVSVEEKAQTTILEKSTWIRDSANLLSNSQKETLAKKLKGFQDSSPEKPQIVVITAKTLGDKTIDEFTNEEFKRIKIGNGKHDNGILIVIAPVERKLRIEVGYGFEGSIPDMIANRIIEENMKPNLAKGRENWYKAIDSAVDAIIQKAKI